MLARLHLLDLFGQRRQIGKKGFMVLGSISYSKLLPLPSSASNLLFSLAYILFVVSITISLFLSAVPCVTAGAICYGSIGRYFAQIGIGPVNYIISDCWPDHLLAKSICYSDTCKSVSMLCGFLTVSSQYSTPWNHQVFICRCGEFRGTTPPLHPLPQHPDRHQALTKW